MIGIDVGTKNIKVCRVEKKGEEFYEVYSVMEAVPDTGKEDREESTDKILSGAIKSAALRQSILKEKSTDNSVVVSLANPDMLIRLLELPVMPREELESTIKLQAERFIFSDLNDMDIDFHSMPPKIETAAADQEDSKLETEGVETQEPEAEAEENKMEVIFVAVPASMVDRQMQIVQDAGFNPVIMDINNLAMVNSYITFEPEAAQQAVILLDIGHTYTTFTILNNGRFCFTRNVKFGGRDLTEEIKKDMEVSLKKADELKKNPETWREIGLNMKGILRKKTPDLLEAVYKSIEYCKSQQLISGIDKMLLSGGTSFLHEIDDFFIDILGIQTERWNCFANIKLLKQKELGPYMSMALGLALRQV
jgi:type IV pilus assembly protein PilM